jgi:hypothetical protein
MPGTAFAARASDSLERGSHGSPIAARNHGCAQLKGGDLNPLNWKKRHLVIWAATTAVGGLAGLIFGWLASPFSRSQGPNTAAMFFTWLHYPTAYLPWAAVGAVIAGLAYYSADLLTGFR